MSREKGDGRGRLGGRQKGTPNRTTSTAREWITKLIDGNRAQIKRDLKELAPKDRLQILEKFMQYVLPKQQAVSANVDINKLTDGQVETVIAQLTQDIDNENND